MPSLYAFLYIEYLSFSVFSVKCTMFFCFLFFVLHISAYIFICSVAGNSWLTDRLTKTCSGERQQHALLIAGAGRHCEASLNTALGLREVLFFYYYYFFSYLRHLVAAGTPFCFELSDQSSWFVLEYCIFPVILCFYFTMLF